MSQPPSNLYESLLAHSANSTPKPPPKIRSSAAVVPWRFEGGRFQVYWVLRSPTMRFMGGWHAFPGGGVARDDTEVLIQSHAQGCSADSFCCPAPGLSEVQQRDLGPDLAPGVEACCLRELFEETGLLLVSGEAELSQDLSEPRQRLLNKLASFADLAAQQGWQLDASQLVFAGRWLTPHFAPMRFDNRFFLLEWPASHALQPTLQGRELDHGEWIEPAQALKQWRRGDAIAAPPIVHILSVLAEDGPVDGLARLRDSAETHLGPMRRIEFQPGIIMMPLRTPTLPPAEHTNTFILGHGDAVLVDPATPHADQQRRMLQALEAAADRGLRIRAIWLTHHHIDHVGAVQLAREFLDVPVLAHAHSVEPLNALGIEVDDTLEHGQVVVLGGDAELTLEVHHTPGHTRGHLSFWLPATGALITGDLLSTLSTIVIDPPEGNMSHYLASLEAMATLEPRMLFPAHGPAVTNGAKVLNKITEHRLARESKILGVYRSRLSTGQSLDAQSLVMEAYDDVPESLHPVAVRQIEAHLERLRDQGLL